MGSDRDEAVAHAREVSVRGARGHEGLDGVEPFESTGGLGSGVEEPLVSRLGILRAGILCADVFGSGVGLRGAEVGDSESIDRRRTAADLDEGDSGEEGEQPRTWGSATGLLLL